MMHEPTTHHGSASLRRWDSDLEGRSFLKLGHEPYTGIVRPHLTHAQHSLRSSPNHTTVLYTIDGWYALGLRAPKQVVFCDTDSHAGMTMVGSA